MYILETSPVPRKKEHKMSENNPTILEPVERPTANAATDALTQRFQDAYAIFNGNTDETINGWLDQNATVFSVSSNRSIVGRTAVQNYFKRQFEDSPQFNPLSPIAVTQNGLTGTVAGSARWVDSNGAETINFVFTFVFAGGQWLLLSMWGHQ
jgi:hypothetical protein